MTILSFYDSDILSWSEQQSDLLRRVAAGEHVNDQVDWENIAEEIEAVGRSERSALASHVGTIIEHLAKLAASPAADPRLGWQETVIRTRGRIDTLITRDKGLRAALDQIVAEEHAPALRLVGGLLALHRETPRVPLDQIRYTTEQVCGDWWPQENGPD